MARNYDPSRPRRGPASARWTVELTGVTRLRNALSLLGETDAPYLRTALEWASHRFIAAAARRAPGSIGRSITLAGVQPSARYVAQAKIVVKHPGAAPMEFGRQYYYRGYKGRAMRATGYRFRVPPGRGQKARPYLGVVNKDAAIGEVQDDIEKMLMDAIEAEWERITAVAETKWE